MEKLDLRILDKDPIRLFRCEYCGCQVPSYNQESTFCYFCELNTSGMDEILKKYPEFYTAITSLTESMNASKWEDADEAMRSLLQMRKSPEMSYTAGVFYKAYSDYMYGNRDYEYLGGYREQNAKNINAGITFFYTSKAFFYSAISQANKNLEADDKDPNMLFVKFMSELKLKRLSDARDTLQRLNQISGSVKSAYASMLYSSTMKDKRSSTFMKQLADIGMINSFYYFAKLLTQENRLLEAKSILIKMLTRVNMPAAKELLDDINETFEIV